MKKVFLSTIVVTALFSCKKETDKTIDRPATEDSTKISTPETPPSTASLKVLDVKKTTDFLQKKK